MGGESVVDVISPQVLSDLIGSIYDCALDPSRWDQTLSDLKDAFHSRSVILRLDDVRHGRPLLMKSAGIESQVMEAAHVVHAAEIRDILLRCLARPPDAAPVASRFLPPGYMETSAYFQAARSHGVMDIMQLALMNEATFFSSFAIGQGNIIGEREIELGKLLLPHLRRSVTISKVLDVRTIEGARMAQTLDALRCAVVLTNEHGAILHANHAAEAMLNGGDPVRSVKGILQASLPSAAQELRAALALAGNEAGIGRTGLAIRLTAPDSDLPLALAHVLPLTGSDFRTRLQPAAVAAVFIGAPVDAQDSAGMAAAAFGLTPAETRVLASLLAGLPLAETATALGITRDTAKNHLNRIFQKTGVTRQADLMRLAMGLIPPAEAKD
jgi:DNA-binding CsgD family transcriptional regulator/PAS domain-containing protein